MIVAAGKPVEISAIVCTRDRSACLKLCLAALERQTLDRRRYEVVVVDNGSRDDTRDVAAAFCQRNHAFHYVFEERSGLAIARNVGVSRSQAPVVAFTDDDAEPEASWLERLRDRFHNRIGEIGVVGGDVIPVWHGSRPPWLVDALLRPLSAGLKWSTEARMLRAGEWLVEVNSAYDKAALLNVGGFPEQLGRFGEILLSGEGGINILIQRAGLGLYYDPQILVRHHIPASRLTKTWFRRRSFWQGVSLYILHCYIEDTSRRLGLPEPVRHTRRWEELRVPISVGGWLEIFDDGVEESFVDQLNQLEHLGYLLESQSVLMGR